MIRLDILEGLSNLVSSIIALVPNDVKLGYVAAKMTDCYWFISHFAVPQKR